MSDYTAESLRFPPVAGLTIRAEPDGGPMSTDIGPLLLREVDRQERYYPAAKNDLATVFLARFFLLYNPRVAMLKERE